MKKICRCTVIKEISICMIEQKKKSIHSIDSVFFKKENKETTFISLNKESTYKKKKNNEKRNSQNIM